MTERKEVNLFVLARFQVEQWYSMTVKFLCDENLFIDTGTKLLLNSYQSSHCCSVVMDVLQMTLIFTLVLPQNEN